MTSMIDSQPAPAVQPRPVPPRAPRAFAQPVKDLWRLRWAAFCLSTFLLFEMIDMFGLMGGVGDPHAGDGNSVNQIVVIALTGMMALCCWRPSRMEANLAIPWPLLGLFGYCLFTLTWSDVPLIGFRRLVLAVMSMWLLFRCVNELGYGRTLFFVRAVFIMLLVANYLAVMFSPHGIHGYVFGDASTEAGSWRGAMIHKNIAGPACALTIMFFVFDRRTMPVMLRNAVLVAVVIFLWFTQSKSSMSSLAIALTTGYAVRFLRISKGSQTVIYVGLVAVLLLAVGGLFYSNALEQLDDPNAFTGRMQIWMALLLYAKQHLWTGAGFSSFWQVGTASPILHLAKGWVAEEAAAGHNGYLDLTVTIGLPGMILAVVLLLLRPAQRLMLAEKMPSESRSLLFSVVVFCICNNFAESQLIGGMLIDQMFLSIVLALMPFALGEPMVGRGGRKLLTYAGPQRHKA